MDKAPLVRSPLFLFRFVVGLFLAGVGAASLVIFEHALLGLRRDIVSLQGSWPGWVPTAVEATVATAILATIVATNIGLLAHRRLRRWALVNVAAIGAIALSALSVALVDSLATSDELARAVRSTGSEASLGNAGLASLIAVLTLGSPWISRRLRPWVTGVIIGGISLSFVGAAISVVTLPLDIGVGMVAGSLVALLFKTRDRTPSPEEVADTLRANGVKAGTVVRAAVDARGSVPWFVTTTSGDELFVKTLDSDHRAADLLFRLYRWLRLRRSGDRRPFSSLERAVEHEALLSLATHARGIRTPQLITIADIGTSGILLAYERIAGRSLDEFAPDDVSPHLLRDVWRLVAELDRAGIAHRDLRLANILVADDGRPWLIDFGFAELSAPHALRSRDVAELIGSTSVAVGAERAVASAVEVLGPEHVAEALPWIQPLALSTATRTQLGKTQDFKHLRAVVAEAAGVPEVPHPRMERISVRSALVLASVAVAAYLLIPQFSELSGFFDELRHATPGWVAIACVASALTYVGAAVGFLGAVPVRLPFGPMMAAQVASSFANRITPAKLGGMATNVRFLQRKSIDPSAAVAAVGLNTVAGFVVHASLIVAVGVIAGTSANIDFPLPSRNVTAIVVGALILLSGVFMLIPRGRRILTKNFVPALKTAATTTSAVGRNPTKLAALILGSALITLSYTVAMLASLRAVGVNLPVAAAALVYLGGAAVATAAPTPGGIGATEAALIGGYAAIGVAATPAFTAVLLFRLVTFWLPILPGWLALVTLERRGDL